MQGSCGELLAKRTNKYEKAAAEFAEFKENFPHCKVPKGLHTRERSLFQTTKEDLLIITKKNSDPNHNYIDEKSSNGERVYNLI